MKLSHARGATQDGQVMVERSDRMWSTGEGKSLLIGKDPDAGQEEKEVTEDEMVGWHH